MRDQQTWGKVMILERKCTERVEKLRTALESQLHNGVSSTESFFSVKSPLLFHNSYSKSSRDTLQLSPLPTEDIAPLFIQYGSPWKHQDQQWD
ncbi:hypothetical protein J4Q44_G00211410 [Coregonus suidteri]|uniref:Uncharacterized protein n=1 Tax=Coregonus suidteri TaxID=861788 RepID=A0AAN8LJT0_9TELE